MTTPWIPPADAITTDSTTALYTAIRAAALAFEDPMVADPQYQLAALLAGVNGGQDRIFARNVPNVNNVVFPYVTLLLDRITTPGSNGYREGARMEMQVVGRPASQGPLVEFIADRLDRCFLSLRLSSAPGDATDYGLVTCRNRQRSTLPPFTTPAESDTYGVRMVFDLILWPRELTQYRADVYPSA